jgi:hypothetical protein
MPRRSRYERRAERTVTARRARIDEEPCRLMSSGRTLCTNRAYAGRRLWTHGGASQPLLTIEVHHVSYQTHSR